MRCLIAHGTSARIPPLCTGAGAPSLRSRAPCLPPPPWPPSGGQGRPRNRWAANWMPRQGGSWEPDVLLGKGKARAGWRLRRRPHPWAEVTFQSQPAALFMSRRSDLKPKPKAPVPSAEPRAWPTEGPSLARATARAGVGVGAACENVPQALSSPLPGLSALAAGHLQSHPHVTSPGSPLPNCPSTVHSPCDPAM